jgi:hypothetical protein
MNQAEARKIWEEAVEKVKDRTIAPTLWRALELGHGITAEDDFFIVGFLPSDSPMTGYLTSSEHRIIIEQALTELLGKPTRLKIVEGITPADYEAFKKREAAAEAARRAAYERKREERAVEKEWESTAEQCSRRYAGLPMRQFPQVRAAFIFDAVQIISETIDRLHPDGKLDEVAQRALARVIEKVATLADVPAAVIGTEVLRYRKENGKPWG